MPDNAHANSNSVKVKDLTASSTLQLSDCLGCDPKRGSWKRYQVMCLLVTDTGQQTIELSLREFKEMLDRL